MFNKIGIALVVVILNITFLSFFIQAAEGTGSVQITGGSLEFSFYPDEQDGFYFSLYNMHDGGNGETIADDYCDGEYYTKFDDETYCYGNDYSTGINDNVRRYVEITDLRGVADNVTLQIEFDGDFIDAGSSDSIALSNLSSWKSNYLQDGYSIDGDSVTVVPAVGEALKLSSFVANTPQTAWTIQKSGSVANYIFKDDFFVEFIVPSGTMDGVYVNQLTLTLT